MMTNKFGEIILQEQDLCDLVMQGRDITEMSSVTVTAELDLPTLISHLENPGNLVTWRAPEHRDINITEFDRERQTRWFMPEEYQQIDIAQHILGLCTTQAQLQRAGEELLLFQEHDLFDLLRYLRYLVDVMRENHIVWGVGRGSSVASYVLYLLGVHRIDSMFYDLDPREFLR
jgi:hypothetical protein